LAFPIKKNHEYEPAAIGHTAFQLLCPRHLVGIQQFTEHSVVEEMFMGGIVSITDDHGRLTR
jgi:hypothetical protein